MPAMPATPPTATASLAAPLSEQPLARTHQQRLRSVWRSAGWPCHDGVELDLLAAGYLLRQWDAQGRDTLVVSELGIEALASARATRRRAISAHEALVARAAQSLVDEGRWVWRGLRVLTPRAPSGGSCQAGPWVTAMPDVFAIRSTLHEEALEPLVLEIKVSRSDLLADLRSPGKAAAYDGLAGAVIYVLAEGVGGVDDVPPPFGVWQVDGPATDRLSGLRCLRPPERRRQRLSLSTWLALAKATPWAGPRDDLTEGAGLRQLSLAPVEEAAACLMGSTTP